MTDVTDGRDHDALPNAPADGVAGPLALDAEGRAASSILSRLVRLALPSIIGTTSLTVMQFIDGWMVSLLDRRGIDGGVNLAASFNGGITAFVPLALCFGVAGLVNTFSAQHMGNGQPLKGTRFAWQGLWLSVFSIPMFFILWLAIGHIFRLFGHTGELLRLETLFARYMLATAPINFASLVIGSFFLGLHRPMVQVIAGITGNVLNLLLDYILIFGHFGFPALHLLGAAIATLTASIISLLILAWFFVRWHHELGASMRQLWKISPPELLQLLRVGLPAGAQIAGDIFCWTIFTLAWVDHFGPEAAEAQSAVMRYVSISFMPAVGLGNAVTALAGNRIGNQDLPGAMLAVKWGIRLAITYMGICGLIFWLGRGMLASVFLSNPEALAIAEKILIFSAIFQIFDAMNVIFISALRAAGDTVIPSIITLGSALLISVIGGGIVTFEVPQLGVNGPWIMATIYICFSGMANFTWWSIGRWKRIDLLKGHRAINTRRRGE